jgi:hypothetical protein
MGLEGSLLCSQEPTTGSYSDPNESIPWLLHLFLLRSIVICFHLSVGLQSSLIVLGLPTKTLYEFFSPVYYMSCPSHPPCFDHPNSIW